jgi:hypothetical protein
MLILLFLFFLLVMAAGTMLAWLEIRGRALPLRFSSAHGALGIAAIMLLTLQAIDHPDNRLVNVSVVIFMLTALGGLLLFAFRATRQKLPLAVVLLHALFAVTALILLAAGLFTGAA